MHIIEASVSTQLQKHICINLVVYSLKIINRTFIEVFNLPLDLVVKWLPSEDANILEQYLQSQQGILERNHHFGSTSHLQPRKDETTKSLCSKSLYDASLAKTLRGRQKRIMRVNNNLAINTVQIFILPTATCTPSFSPLTRNIQNKDLSLSKN